MDSNHRRLCQRIYSPLPLAAREPIHENNDEEYEVVNGAGDGTRTRNLLITNQLLCQLSYTSIRMYRQRIFTEKMAIRRGLEPLTSSVTGWHSNQLNYRTTLLFAFKKVGGPSGTRTPDQSVMSRPL